MASLASSDVGGFNFLIVHTGRGVMGFICPLPVLWAVLLVAPRVFWVPKGPAACEARRPHFVWRRASKPARALVVGHYALSAEGSSPVTSPCTLGW